MFVLQNCKPLFLITHCQKQCPLCVRRKAQPTLPPTLKVIQYMLINILLLVFKSVLFLFSLKPTLCCQQDNHNSFHLHTNRPHRLVHTTVYFLWLFPLKTSHHNSDRISIKNPVFYIGSYNIPTFLLLCTGH